MAKILKIGEAMETALRLLRAGEIVAIPTETVYGLAGDATSGAALARIFEVKRRPRFNPLILHVAGMAMAEQIGVFDRLSRKLADLFWPGPLTLILPLAPGSGIHELALAGLDTVALRMPQGFGAQLAGGLGCPLAAPSANTSGRVSPTTAEAVAADLGALVPLIVDGGPTAIGLESTIVKVEDERLLLLRPGGIAAELIEAATRLPLRRHSGPGVEAPGMLASHYAPRAELRLEAAEVRPGEALLAFGPRRAAALERRRRRAQPLPPGTSGRQRAICSPICGRSTRRRRPSRSSRSPRPGSARRSMTGWRVPPRRAPETPR